MKRAFNFSAGPAALPTAVLERAAGGLLDLDASGCGVMEISHRGARFTEIARRAEASLRSLLAVPDNYRVLFLQGGATQQFAQIPFNLLDGGSADYLVWGTWSRKAWHEARRLAPLLGGTVRLAGEIADATPTRHLRHLEMDLDPQARFVHLCTNETIHGIEVLDEASLPPGEVPLVADMSSHILAQPIDVSRYGMIYAGAQKNIGPSGLVIVIIREDLLGRAWAGTPAVMDYAEMAAHDSMLNTPATWSIYVAGLVFEWLHEQGGLTAMAAINADKAAQLYACIDASDGFYRNPVEVACRSQMNVPFFLADSRLDADFLAGAEAAGLKYLKGHKSTGGMRASIYNAVPLEAVAALVAYMRAFAARHG